MLFFNRLYCLALVFSGSGNVLAAPPGESCSVDLDALTGKYPPLLLKNKDFIFPTEETEQGHRLVMLNDGDELELFCHGSTRYQDQTYIQLAGVPEEKSVKVTCVNGGIYYGEDKVVVTAATCNRRQEPRLTRSAEECSPIGADGRTTGLEDLVLVQVGWLIEDTFIEQIRVCHDEKVYGTIWTNHTLYGPNINFRDIDSGRPSFRIDNSYLKRFYTWTTSTNMNDYYSKDDQEATAIQLLGHNEVNSKPLIETSTSGTNYFAKGHLSPDAGFVYNVLQDATYYFFNAAPQYQSFNNGNWKALEYNTRDLAIKSNKVLSITTGTHGVLKYHDTNNNEVPIYLYNDNELSYIPAPEYYWKVVHDPEADAAVAFIGLNDPHATEPPTELCTNVCSEMAWVDWSVTELGSGYMYCCSIEDARSAIPSMPNIKASSLLQLVESPVEASCTAGGCTCTCKDNACSCKCAGADVATVTK